MIAALRYRYVAPMSGGTSDRTGSAHSRAPGAIIHQPLPAAAARWTLAAGLALALICWLADGWTTAIGITLVTLCTVQGLRLGALEIGGIAAGTILALTLAPPLGRGLEGGFSAITSMRGLANRAVSIATIGVAIIFAGGVCGRVILRSALPPASPWHRRNSLLGAALGLAEGLCLMLALMWVIFSLEPVAAIRLANRPESLDPEQDQPPRRREPVPEFVIDLARTLRSTAAGRLAADTNPLEGARILALARAFAEVSRHPPAMRWFTRCEVIRKIRDLDSFRLAQDLAAQDQVLKEFFTGQPIDAAGLTALVNNDTILRIMDRTSVLADLTPLAEPLEQAVFAARDRIGRPEPQNAADER